MSKIENNLSNSSGIIINLKKNISTKTLLNQDEGGFLILDIIDTGIGMKQSDLSNLFQPFFQAKSDAKYQGTGLGLWITKQLIRTMNGEITVKSKYKYGTTIRVTLPMKINTDHLFSSSSGFQALGSNDNTEKYLLFSPKMISEQQKCKPKKRKYILISYKTQKELILIEDLFYNPTSYFKFNKDILTYDFDNALKLMKLEKEMVNSIILFSTNQFLSSIYFVTQLREIEMVRGYPHIRVLVVGNEEVRLHTQDFRQLSVKNFSFEDRKSVV